MKNALKISLCLRVSQPVGTISATGCYRPTRMRIPATSASTAISGEGRPSGTRPAMPYNASQIPRTSIPPLRGSTTAMTPPLMDWEIDQHGLGGCDGLELRGHHGSAVAHCREEAGSTHDRDRGVGRRPLDHRRPVLDMSIGHRGARRELRCFAPDAETRIA